MSLAWREPRVGARVSRHCVCGRSAGAAVHLELAQLRSEVRASGEELNNGCLGGFAHIPWTMEHGTHRSFDKAWAMG